MVIAVDFDGTIVEHRYPKIGKPIPFAVETLKELHKQGHQLILWTYRAGKYLDEAVAYCKSKGVEFYAVNANEPDEEFDPINQSRKIYADIYIDDRNVGGLMTWSEVWQLLGNAETNNSMSSGLGTSSLKRIFSKRQNN